MNTIFKDQLLSNKFIEEGFVKISFLNEDQLIRIKDHVDSYRDYFQNSSYGICSATDLNNPQLVKEINQFLINELEDNVKGYFENYHLILGNYLVKKPQENTFIPIHQDWSFVDESKYYSLSIWCPLVDVDESNGCLQVVPSSHRLSKNIRPAPKYPDSFQNVREYLPDYLISLPLKAGEAICYDHALLHASPINKSNHFRPAITLGLTHQNAQLCHHFARETSNDENYVTLDKYDMPGHFFINHVRGSAPTTSNLLDSFPYTFEKIDKRDFLRKVKKQ